MNSHHGVAACWLAVIAAVNAVAQTAPVSSTTGKEDEPVKLAAFEVVMTQDKGYHSPYSGLALRTNEEIMKVPQSIGEMREGGIKANLFDGRLTITSGLYSTYYKNWAVSRTGGITPGFTYNVFDLIRDSYIKGWDVSVAARPVPSWQLMFNYARQDPRIQVTNTRLPASFRGSWGVFSSYQFTTEPLKKFRIGGGANRINDRLTGGSQLILPSGVAASAVPGSSASLRLKDGTMATAFVEYQLNRRWHFKLNVNNVLDETFIVGAQNAVAIDPSQPRTFSLIATVRF